MPCFCPICLHFLPIRKLFILIKPVEALRRVSNQVTISRLTAPSQRSPNHLIAGVSSRCLVTHEVTVSHCLRLHAARLQSSSTKQTPPSQQPLSTITALTDHRPKPPSIPDNTLSSTTESNLHHPPPLLRASSPPSPCLRALSPPLSTQQNNKTQCPNP